MNDQDRSLVVLMGGRQLGEVYFDSRKHVRLRYDDDYASDDNATPLSLSMPLALRRHKHTTLAPWLDGLLPDRPDVLMRWRRDFGVRDQSTFALLRHVGEDVAGAAQFVRPDRLEQASAPGSVTPLSIEDVADRLSRLREDPSAWSPTSINGQFSLAGAQSKIALYFQDDQWGLPSGRTPTTHILKPAIQNLDDQDINEHLSMAAARRLGMRVPKSSVETFGDERAFVVERYDRRLSNGAWSRLHQEDMCQALGLSPTQKYEQQGGPSVTTIANLIRTSVPRNNAEDDVRRFVDAIIYNWIIQGTDAHAKNYALLLAGTGVRLAPLYDLNSFLPYRRRDLMLSMKIGSYKYQANAINAEDWRSFARSVDIPADYLFDRIQELTVSVPDAISDVANETSVKNLRSSLPGKLVDAIKQSSQHCSSMSKH